MVVGSELIGQTFVAPQYFHSRPSAAGAGYDGAASSGSNLGPLNPDLLAAVAERVAAYRAENGLADDVAVPVDAVTASGSGLDPHISVANARLQAPRVADARGLSVDEVLALDRRPHRWPFARRARRARRERGAPWLNTRTSTTLKRDEDDIRPAQAAGRRHCSRGAEHVAYSGCRRAVDRRGGITRAASDRSWARRTSRWSW